jgi:hypothetical protein
MPVLFDSSSPPSTSNTGFSGKDGPCGNYVGGMGIRILGAGILFCCVVLLVLRRRKIMDSNSKAGMSPTSPSAAEKGREHEYQSEKKTAKGYEYEYTKQTTTQSSQEPTLFETNLTNVRNLESVPSPSPTYPTPTSSPSDPSSTSEATSSSSQTGLKIDIPRRRSYTKTIVSGGAEIVEVEVNGEIIVSPDGWRRHTRVFGGGVCKACEESERRLSA